jgi:protoheme IX farnesyltransferase
VAGLGWTYTLSATVLGATFTGMALQLMRAPSQKRALRVFSWSITYLTLLFVALAADQLVRSGW